MDVKKFIMLLSSVMIIISTVICSVVSVVMLNLNITRDYQKIAKAAATHVVATIEGQNGKNGQWAYDEATSTLTYADVKVDDKAFSILQAEDEDVHHTIFWGDTRVLSDLKGKDGESVIGTKCDPEIYKKVEKEGYYSANHVKINGTSYTVYYYAIKNGDKMVGMSFCGVVQTAANNVVINSVIISIIITVILLVIAIAVNGYMVGKKFRVANGRIVACAESLDATEGQVQSMSGSVNQFAKQILDATDEVARATTDQAACTQQAMAGVEEFGTSVDVIIQNIEHSLEQSDNMKHKLGDTRTAIEEFKNGSMSNTERMEQVKAGINENKEQIDYISKAIEEIDNVAFQITLLALNAQVEASHAGELGKGFAVVADSIKSLSAKTAESADLIHVAVSNAMEKADSAIDLANELVEGNQKNVEKLEKTMQVFHDLGECIDTVSHNLEEISSETDTTTTIKNQIVEVIQSLAASSEENAAMAEEMQNLVAQIDEKIIELDQKIATLTVVEEDLQNLKNFFVNK